MFVLMRSPATGIGLWLAAGDVIKTVNSRICSFQRYLSNGISIEWNTLQKERLTLHEFGNRILCAFLNAALLIRKVCKHCVRPRSACEYHCERILYVVQQQES